MDLIQTRYLVIILLVILLPIFFLFFLRLFSEVQIDDVSPEIQCEENLLKKSDNLFIIPKFNGKSIADNPEWCEYILSLNKTLSLHGLTHEYREFETDRDEAYLRESIDIFYTCFGFYPKEFKPPQLAISSNNKKLVKSKLRLLGEFNQITHKVYHCNDSTGRNWIADWF
jgi:hypothetical protein